ncbi:MAG: hypothetical protein COB02_03600 [Candidatus Cloacimonadota bacterium]|nr:MAG: hypothetical protein COB02_03600 [Candidatus Cloacimonadota bacterium]
MSITNVLESSGIKKFTFLTMFLFVFSIVQPALMVSFASEADFYDGPNGYMSQSKGQSKYRSYDRIQNEGMAKANKLVGMTLGGIVGGGLVLALGLAASPILAVATLVGSILAGGFLGSAVGNPVRNGINRTTSSSNMMSWIGGIAGGTLGFMIPGGSIIGAAVGSTLGGVAGSYLADNKDRILDAPSRMIRGGFARMSGGMMGPMGAMMGVPNAMSSMMVGTGNRMYPGNWYGPNGVVNTEPRQMVLDQYGQEITPDSHYVWHDDNGDYNYPGWKNDLYKADNSSSFYRRNSSAGWTTGVGTQASRVSDISSPQWGRGGSSSKSPSGRTRINYSDGDVYSTYTTTDGETFNPDYEAGSGDSLVGLTQRYQDAVEELRTLSLNNASDLQRREAHREVQRLERMLHQGLNR